MIISKRLVKKYQEEHRRKFGSDISAKDAERELINLKELVRLITRERKQRHGN